MAQIQSRLVQFSFAVVVDHMIIVRQINNGHIEKAIKALQIIRKCDVQALVLNNFFMLRLTLFLVCS